MSALTRRSPSTVSQLHSLSSCSSSASRFDWIELIQRVPLQTIPVHGHRIAYLDMGQGPPMMLIHGFGGSIWNWEHQIDTLSTCHRVIAMDLLGSGLSDKPDIPYTPSVMVQFFSAFMHALGIERATLVGNSMGAGLAMAMAIDHPAQVSNLVLISGFPPDPRASIASKAYRRFIEHRPPLWLSAIGLRLAGRKGIRSMLEEIIYDHTLITPTVVERSFRNRQDLKFLPPLYSFLDHIQDWTEQYGRRFHDIDVETMILWGTHDRVLPRHVGEDLHQRISRSQLHAIEEAGHMPQWEKPTIVNRLILEFANGPAA